MLNKKRSSWGSRQSSMVSSMPTILRLRVWVPSKPSMLFSICIVEVVMRKGRKEAGIGTFLKNVVLIPERDRMLSTFPSPVMMTSLGASFHSSSIMTPITSASSKFGSGRSESTSPRHTSPNTVNSSTEAARNFLNQFNISHALQPPSQVELRESGSGNPGLGVWATESIPAGTKFGPFLGKWCLEPVNQSQAWEVSLALYFQSVTQCPLFKYLRISN